MVVLKYATIAMTNKSLLFKGSGNITKVVKIYCRNPMLFALSSGFKLIMVNCRRQVPVPDYLWS